MWRMLQADEPGDYVLATGVGNTVRDFLALAFDQAGLDWEKYVRFDDRYRRPAEVDALIGDASLAESELGWKPRVLIPELVKIMVESDVRAFEDRRTEIDRPDLPSWQLGLP
jgi:GDPmannose 4,6-dehydratase